MPLSWKSREQRPILSILHDYTLLLAASQIPDTQMPSQSDFIRGTARAHSQLVSFRAAPQTLGGVHWIRDLESSGARCGMQLGSFATRDLLNCPSLACQAGGPRLCATRWFIRALLVTLFSFCWLTCVQTWNRQIIGQSSRCAYSSGVESPQDPVCSADSNPVVIVIPQYVDAPPGDTSTTKTTMSHRSTDAVITICRNAFYRHRASSSGDARRDYRIECECRAGKRADS